MPEATGGAAAPLTAFSGVGPKKAEQLAALGITSVETLLRHYPRRYEDRRQVRRVGDVLAGGLGEGEAVVLRVRVLSVSAPPFSRGGRSRIPLRVRAEDDTGALTLLFFGATWLRNAFSEGADYWVYGPVRRDLSGPVMVHPEFERAEEGKDYGGIVPVYGLTAGVTQKFLRGLVRQALDGGIGRLAEEFLPPEIVTRHRLAPPDFALGNIHFPENDGALRSAQYRLVFEELFLLQTGLLWVRRRERGEGGIAFGRAPSVSEFEDLLPFAMTGAQRRATEEVYADMERPAAMHRLLQGDVGSGKTAVAMAGCCKAARGGHQSVVMAPTEILAAQHFAEFSKTLGEGAGLRTGFLASGLAAKEKADVKERLAAGEIDVLVGTHSVLEPDVVFARLGFVVTDEQHRFGVAQRLRLRDKGSGAVPDVLVMSATPIPRTLALILYGDLDVSVIDEMPPGRKPVETRFVDGTKRGAVYDFVEKQLRKGRQAYVVAPMIADADAEEDMPDSRDAPENDNPCGGEHRSLPSAEGLFAELSERFRGFRVGLLHGGMKQREKEAAMLAFVSGETDLLCATVVIEVGVNVPNATVMVVEGAERFGLAQLHQLRGRVGRGAERSYCVLISDSRAELARRRGETLAETNDGFKIAEIDLELRGPGDLFGVRQHGIPELKIADLAKHLKVVQAVSEEAKALFAADPELTAREHAPLRKKLSQLEAIG
ncbi:MAG: ATP-dependent DNA helicase RecG [Clostridiales Family XIII bacterium]|jgi:ATP-dependent DNA helicase RecG|nr:ATP-dependent DNA helicase RecG [Clostridiales Family XIII bacterium]